MITGIAICIIYILLLFGVTKLFGVKYTDILKSTTNIKIGILYPVGIATILITVFAVVFKWAPGVFTFTPRVDQPWFWVIPGLYIVGIIVRLTHAAWEDLGKRAIAYIFVGTAFVGFSEELLVRGILVTALLDSGYSVFVTGLLSSVIFGVLHFVNYFNGQSIKTTLMQVIGTILAGLTFFAMLVVSGTLWLPILIHFLFDFSILVQGGEVNQETGREYKYEKVIILIIYTAALASLLFL